MGGRQRSGEFFEQLIGFDNSDDAAAHVLQEHNDRERVKAYQKQEFLNEERSVGRRRLFQTSEAKLRAVSAYLMQSGLRLGCVVKVSGHPAIVVRVLSGLRFSVRYLDTLAVVDRQVMYWDDQTNQYRSAFDVLFVPPKSHMHPWLVTERPCACVQDDRHRAYVASRLASEARLATQWGEYWNIAEVEKLLTAFEPQ